MDPHQLSQWLLQGGTPPSMNLDDRAFDFNNFDLSQLDALSLPTTRPGEYTHGTGTTLGGRLRPSSINAHSYSYFHNTIASLDEPTPPPRQSPMSSAGNSLTSYSYAPSSLRRDNRGPEPSSSSYDSRRPQRRSHPPEFQWTPTSNSTVLDQQHTPSDMSSPDVPSESQCESNVCSTPEAEPSSPKDSRKFITSDKRRVQNRAAQRAYRARKEQHAQRLEVQLSAMTQRYERLRAAHRELGSQCARMRQTLDLLLEQRTSNPSGLTLQGTVQQGVGTDGLAESSATERDEQRRLLRTVVEGMCGRREEEGMEGMDE